MENFEKVLLENLQICNLLSKWQVIRLQDLEHLLSNCGRKGQYSKVSKMHKLGFVEKIKIPSSDRATRYALIFAKSARDKLGITYHHERFYHDLIVSTIAAEFTKFPSFVSVLFEHEFEKRATNGEFLTKGIMPDALIHAQNSRSKDEFTIALEVEMTRKSFNRIRDKFLAYSSDPRFSKVVYFFTELKMFESYIRSFGEPEVQTKIKGGDKFVFVLINDPNTIREDINDLKAFSEKQYTTFGEIFL